MTPQRDSSHSSPSSPRWRVVAVDDEPPALLALEQALASAPDFDLVGRTTDSTTAAALVRSARADVVFLDIQMPGASGFDVINALDDPLPLVVFVTAFNEHALAAFDARALDYVLKPIDPERFAKTLQSVCTRLHERNAVEMTNHLRTSVGAALRYLDRMATPSDTPYTALSARIPVKVDGRVILLDPATIDRVESDNNTVSWYVGKERFDTRDTLNHAVGLLPPSHFARVHRSTVVNLARVRAVEPYIHGEYVIHLHDGTRVVTGRSYREQVKTLFRLDDVK